MTTTPTLTYVSLFAGIGAFDAALERAGMTCVRQVEKDRNCLRVLAKHWPHVLKDDDVATYNPERGAADVVCGGWPCQGNSVAGKRGGLADPRSGLFVEFVRVADETAARWVLGENVPGILSVRKGRDWATVLEMLTGYRPEVPPQGWQNAGFCVGPKRSLAWRSLDAQFVGGCPVHVDERGIGPVPQQRRRVFVVADSRRGPGPAEILFEPESCERNPEKSGQTRSRVAANLRSRSASNGGEDDLAPVAGTLPAHHPRNTAEDADRLVVVPYNVVGLAQQGKNHAYPADVSGCLQHKGLMPTGNEAGTVIAYTVNAAESCAKKSHARESELARCLDQTGGFAANQGGTVIACNAMAFNWQGGGTQTTLGLGDKSSSLSVGQVPAVLQGMAVRRLTPTECLRLMGLPDDWLDLTPPLSDSTKYRLVGNSIALPVALWIARRIVEFVTRSP